MPSTSPELLNVNQDSPSDIFFYPDKIINFPHRKAKLPTSFRIKYNLSYMEIFCWGCYELKLCLHSLFLDM